MLLLAVFGLSVNPPKCAIVICGAPPAGEQDREKLASYYRVLADGLWMSRLLENDGYRVHCLYSVALANVFGNRICRHVTNVDGPNLLERGNRLRPSALGPGVVAQPDLFVTLRALRNIVITNGSQVVVYLRGHGGLGHISGPTGEKLMFYDVVNALLSKHVHADVLLIVDACFSGSINQLNELFRDAARRGRLGAMNFQVITSTGWRRSRCDYLVDVVINGQRLRVRSSSVFRHRLMLAISDRYQKYGADASGLSQWTWSCEISELASTKWPTLVRSAGIPPQQPREEIGSRFFSFGNNDERVGRWIGVNPHEPVLNTGRNGEAELQAVRPVLEHWEMGEYESFEGDDGFGRKRAVSEHEAFRILMKDLHEQFGVELSKSCRKPKPRLSGMVSLVAVIASIEDNIGLTGTRFTPNWCVVVNLFVTLQGKEKELLESIEAIARSRRLRDLTNVDKKIPEIKDDVLEETGKPSTDPAERKFGGRRRHRRRHLGTGFVRAAW